MSLYKHFIPEGSGVRRACDRKRYLRQEKHCSEISSIGQLPGGE